MTFRGLLGLLHLGEFGSHLISRLVRLVGLHVSCLAELHGFPGLPSLMVACRSRHRCKSQEGRWVIEGFRPSFYLELVLLWLVNRYF